MSTATRSEADTLGCRYFNSDWRLLVVHLHLHLAWIDLLCVWLATGMCVVGDDGVLDE